MTNKYKNIKPLVIGVGLAGKRHLNTQINLGIKTGVYKNSPEAIKNMENNDDIKINNQTHKWHHTKYTKHDHENEVGHQKEEDQS